MVKVNVWCRAGRAIIESARCTIGPVGRPVWSRYISPIYEGLRKEAPQRERRLLPFDPKATLARPNAMQESGHWSRREP